MTNSLSAFIPSQEMSIDEAIIGFKGRSLMGFSKHLSVGLGQVIWGLGQLKCAVQVCRATRISGAQMTRNHFRVYLENLVCFRKPVYFRFATSDLIGQLFCYERFYCIILNFNPMKIRQASANASWPTAEVWGRISPKIKKKNGPPGIYGPI